MKRGVCFSFRCFFFFSFFFSLELGFFDQRIFPFFLSFKRKRMDPRRKRSHRSSPILAVKRRYFHVESFVVLRN